MHYLLQDRAGAKRVLKVPDSFLQGLHREVAEREKVLPYAMLGHGVC